MSKRGERTIRRLLILGASAVVRWARQRGTPDGSWLARMLARKPPMLVTVALANKTARIVGALLVKGGVYQGFGRRGGVSCEPRPRGRGGEARIGKAWRNGRRDGIGITRVHQRNSITRR